MKPLLLLAASVLAPLAASATVYNFSTAGLNSMEHGTAYTWGLDNSSNNNVGNNYDTLRGEIAAGKTVLTAQLKITKIWDWANETVDPYDALYINILKGLDAGVKSKQFDANFSANDTTAWGVAGGPVNPFIDILGSTTSFNYRLQNSITGYTGVLNFTDAGTNSLLKYDPTAGADYTAAGATGAAASVSWSDPNGGFQNRTGYLNGFDLVIDFTTSNIACLQALLAWDTSTNSPTVGLGFGPECHYYDTGVSLQITTNGTSVPDGGNTLLMLGLAVLSAVGARRFSRKSLVA